MLLGRLEHPAGARTRVSIEYLHSAVSLFPQSLSLALPVLALFLPHFFFSPSQRLPSLALFLSILPLPLPLPPLSFFFIYFFAHAVFIAVYFTDIIKLLLVPAFCICPFEPLDSIENLALENFG